MSINRFEKKKQGTHQHILDNSVRLFLNYGVDNVSLEEIAKECDIARGTLYNHFSNKTALIEHILTPAFDTIDKYTSELLIKAEDASISIEDVLSLCLKLWQDNKEHMKFVYLIKPQQMGTLFDRHIGFINNLVYLLSHIQRNMDFRVSDPKIAASVMFKTFIPLLDVIGKQQDYERLFIESMRGLLLV